MKYLLVFGSLRKNSDRGYNFQRFGQDQQYIRDVELDGFEMYDLKHYPTICEGTGKIKTELHSVNESSYRCICGMEAGAGYKEKKIKLSDGTEASIFVWAKNEILKYKLERVESGDWN